MSKINIVVHEVEVPKPPATYDLMGLSEDQLILIGSVMGCINLLNAETFIGKKIETVGGRGNPAYTLYDSITNIPGIGAKVQEVSLAANNAMVIKKRQ